ncbi:flagellar hook protein FlgE [Roseibium aestuarii]|uniref:Flagellar hook protein FlgE n=1 Tax=Roseibium aestuarii TaxID=2600299 RepID=A0ABW4JZ67_9HYPH|nr:flagellar hook-basal body complex protein [Roseibium aestuarii]
MSLMGAINSAISSLHANSQALANVSDNLANSNTTAYKTTGTSFSSLVAGSANSSSGGVISTSKANVTEQGLLTATSSATDLAIEGDGFFVVTDGTNAYYTRNGEFEVDEDGYLTNGDYFLMGWATDDAGNIKGGTTEDSLATIDIDSIQSSVDATTHVDMQANLPANAVATSTTNTAAEIATGLSTDIAATSGDTLSFDINGTTITATASASNTITVADLVAAINGSSATTGVSASTNTDGELVLSSTATGSAATFTVDNVTGSGSLAAADLSTLGISGTGTATGTTTVTPGDSYETTVEVYDSLGTSATVTVTWTKTAENAWEMSFSDAVNDAGKVIGTVSTGTIQVAFNENGTLASTTPANPAIQITGWTTGAADSDIDFGLGTAGSDDGLTQYSSDEDDLQIEIQSITQDGLAYGNLSSIEISDDGSVTAFFDNGEERVIYKIAVATFANSNGLTEKSDGIYARSSSSGNSTLHVAGMGGAGTINGGYLEASTVDTSKEFSSMLSAQQAYSASSQIMSTASDMFDKLLDAVR